MVPGAERRDTYRDRVSLPTRIGVIGFQSRWGLVGLNQASGSRRTRERLFRNTARQPLIRSGSRTARAAMSIAAKSDASGTFGSRNRMKDGRFASWFARIAPKSVSAETTTQSLAGALDRFALCKTSREQTQHSCNGNAQVTHTGSASHLCRLYRDPCKVRHSVPKGHRRWRIEESEIRIKVRLDGSKMGHRTSEPAWFPIAASPLERPACKIGPPCPGVSGRRIAPIVRLPRRLVHRVLERARGIAAAPEVEIRKSQSVPRHGSPGVQLYRLLEWRLGACGVVQNRCRRRSRDTSKTRDTGDTMQGAYPFSGFPTIIYR